MGTADGLPPDVSSALQGRRKHSSQEGAKLSFHFTVTGEHNNDVLRRIDSCLEAYSPHSRWNVDIDVRPHVVTGAGATVSYEADVTALWLGPE